MNNETVHLYVGQYRLRNWSGEWSEWKTCSKFFDSFQDALHHAGKKAEKKNLTLSSSVYETRAVAISGAVI